MVVDAWTFTMAMHELRASCDEILRDRQRFRRLRRTELDLLVSRIAAHSYSRRRLDFVLEWGLGAGATIGEEDLCALEHAAESAARLAAAAGVSAQLMLLLTDTHATVNGLTPEEWKSYAESIRFAAESRGHSVSMLSDLVEKSFGRDWMTQVDSIVDRDRSWSGLTEYQGREMIRRARRCVRRGDVETAARRYVQVSIIEGLAMLLHLPHSVVLTYHVPSFSFLVPPLAKVQVFVRPGRVTERPWFRHYPCGGDA